MNASDSTNSTTGQPDAFSVHPARTRALLDRAVRRYHGLPVAPQETAFDGENLHPGNTPHDERPHRRESQLAGRPGPGTSPAVKYAAAAYQAALEAALAAARDALAALAAPEAGHGAISGPAGQDPRAAVAAADAAYQAALETAAAYRAATASASGQEDTRDL